MKSNTTKVLKLQMLVLAGVVYFFNAMISLMLTGLEEFKLLYKGADFQTAFMLGLIFALFSLYGYVHARSRTIMQMFSFAYMLPLTGACLMTLSVLYYVQKPMTNTLGLWILMTFTGMLLALSFGMFWKAAEQDSHVTL